MLFLVRLSGQFECWDCKLLRSGANKQEWNGVGIVGLLSKELNEDLISVSMKSDRVIE